MKLTRREGILLAHLTNLSTNDIRDILSRKGYTREQADELLQGKSGHEKDCAISLWHKTGQKIDGKVKVYNTLEPTL